MHTKSHVSKHRDLYVRFFFFLSFSFFFANRGFFLTNIALQKKCRAVCQQTTRPADTYIFVRPSFLSTLFNSRPIGFSPDTQNIFLNKLPKWLPPLRPTRSLCPT